jgi:transposase
MRPYSMGLRERVLADCDAGRTAAQAADRFRVSRAWVYRLLQRRRRTGAVAPRKAGPRRPRALDAHADRLRAAVAAKPDATLAELRADLGLGASLSEFCRALQRLRLTLKKRRSGPPSRGGPT